MDPDPDRDPGTAIFVIDIRDANKNLIFIKLYYFLNVHLHNFSKVKILKKSNSRNKGISYFVS
jgi:hypothetical protein